MLSIQCNLQAKLHPTECSFAISDVFFSILSNIETRNANMDTACFDTASSLVGNQGFCSNTGSPFRRVNGLNSPRIVLLIVDSPFEIEKVFIAF